MQDVDSAFKSPVVLSLCPGIRGLERGIERALRSKLRVAAYVEIEAFVIGNLLAGMEEGVVDAAPIWSNLKTFDAKPFRGKIHGIIGGYPCQPFSGAGLRKGESDPRHLYPFISRIVKKSRPLWCLFENVEGHISLGFEFVQKDLRKMGYSVEAGLYSAAEAGAPHRRNRLFILAVENTYLQRVRGRDNEARSGQIQAQGSGELADTRHNRYGLDSINRSQGKSEEEPEEFLSGCLLDKSEIKRCESGRIQRGDEKGYTKYNDSSETMGHTDNEGLQRRCSGKCEECGCQRPSGKDGSQWPSRPGEEQYIWEEPRIVEPGMGCTVDGYNFREDFLRALGNSVVEQTAEIAFIDLLKKHGIPMEL